MTFRVKSTILIESFYAIVHHNKIAYLDVEDVGELTSYIISCTNI